MKYLRKNKRIISIIFLIFVSVLCHIKYILGKGNFYRGVNTDSFNQLIRMIPFLEENILKRQWSWSYGLGGDIFSEFSYYYTTSPFFYIQLLIKKLLKLEIQNYTTIIVGKIIINIFRQSLAMIFMYILLLYEREEGEKEKSNSTALIGAICYGTSMLFLSMSLRFDFMNDCYVWIPLTFLAYRYYEQKKKIWFLLITVAITTGNSFYFGFINCVFYGIYFLYFSYKKKIAIKDYCIKIMKIVFLCILGIGISCIFFLPAVRGLFMADRVAITGDLSVIPDMNLIKNFYNYFFSFNGIITAPFFIFLFFCIEKADRTTLFVKKLVFMLFWILMSIIPFVNCFMNGFSYNTNRWHYIVIFAIAYFIPDLLERLSKISKSNWIKIEIVCIILFLISTYQFFKVPAILSKYEFINFVFNIYMIIILIQCSYLKNYQKILRKYWLVFVFSILAVIKAYSIQTTWNNKEAVNDLLFGTEKEQMITSILEPKSNEFYRVSDEKAASEETNLRYENTSLNNGIYGLTAYNSMIDGNLHKWIKKTYNIRGVFVSPSYYRGFDGRYFLEIAWGVKYKINYNFEKYLQMPYGYYESKKSNNENTNLHILENKYDIGIDLWYDSIISEEEFENLDYAYKDACILQTAVIKDTQYNYPKTKLEDVTYSVNVGDYIYENCEYKNGEIVVEKENCAKVIIPFIEKKEGGEYLYSFQIIEENDKQFELNLNGKRTIKYSSKYEWTYPIDYFTVKFDSNIEGIEISLPTVGTYKISNERIYFNSYEKLDNWTRRLNQYNLENLYIGDNYISGSIENRENGILALSIPYNDGWKCFVDGKEVNTLKVNKVFTGIELKAGKFETNK